MSDNPLKLYEEDGAVAVVEILEDGSNDDWERYKLKVVKEIQKAWHGGRLEIGYTFDVDKKKNCAMVWGIWSLNEIPHVEEKS